MRRRDLLKKIGSGLAALPFIGLIGCAVKDIPLDPVEELLDEVVPTEEAPVEEVAERVDVQYTFEVTKEWDGFVCDPRSCSGDAYVAHVANHLHLPKSFIYRYVPDVRFTYSDHGDYKIVVYGSIEKPKILRQEHIESLGTDEADFACACLDVAFCYCPKSNVPDRSAYYDMAMKMLHVSGVRLVDVKFV